MCHTQCEPRVFVASEQALGKEYGFAESFSVRAAVLWSGEVLYGSL